MKELSQHIETLLLENDCVIIPGFGGFVAHYASAQWVEEECIYLPPTRNIGFNPQLKMNDGLLVQSYMAVHDTNFSDAQRIIDKEIQELIATLHEEGRADLPNVGELHFTIHGTYEFTPFNNKITTPSLYGLDAVSITPLKQKSKVVDRKPVVSYNTSADKNTYNISINRTFVRHAAAVAAAIVMFFMLSVPVENTEIRNENYAQLMPSELFASIEKQSVTTALVGNTEKVVTGKAAAGSTAHKTVSKAVKPKTVKEVTVPAVPKVTKETETVAVKAKAEVQEIKANSSDYHIIIASSIGQKDAESLAEKLKAKGYKNARVLKGNSVIRVSIDSYDNREEAGKKLSQVRQNDEFATAWVLTPANK